MMQIALILASFIPSLSFIIRPRILPYTHNIHFSTSAGAIEANPVKTWQEDLDQILDVDTSCEGRRELSLNFLKY